MTDDAELLRQYAETGAEPAFAELVRRRLGLVYSVALRQTAGDAHLAEDAAQKVFTQMARKARPLSGHPAVSAWLYRTAQYEAINLARNERRRRQREQEAQQMETLNQAAPSVANDATVRAALDQAMADLAERERTVVMLRFFEEQPFAEIGRRLRVTEDAARMRTDRALEKLRLLLERRGIASAAGALGGMLTQQAGAAVPARLAGTIAVAAALAGQTPATPLGLAALLMTSTKVQIVAVASVAANVLLLGFAAYHTPEMIRRAEAAERTLTTVSGTERAVALLPGVAADPGLNLGVAAWQELAKGDPKALYARLRATGMPEDLAARATVMEIFARFLPRYREVYGLNEPMPPFWSNTARPALYLIEPPRRLAAQAYWRDFTGVVEAALGPGAMYTVGMAESEKDAWRDRFGDMEPERAVQLVMEGWKFTTEQVEASWRTAIGQGTKQDQEIAAAFGRDQQAATDALLTPEERERFELRYHPAAQAVRKALVMLNPSEEEFRAVFTVRKAYEAEKGSEPAANATAARTAWNAELNTRIAAVLSPERSAEFALKNLYATEASQLARLVTRLNLPFENVGRILALQQSTQQQLQAIVADRSLTRAASTQRRETLMAGVRATITAALGGDPRMMEVFRLNGGSWAFNPWPAGATTP